MTYAIIYHTPEGVHQINVEADEVIITDKGIAIFADTVGDTYREVAAFCLDGIIGYFENPSEEEVVN